jgi:hypothetical protein
MNDIFMQKSHELQQEWLQEMQDPFCIAKEKLKKKLRYLFSNKHFEHVEQIEREVASHGA